MLFYQNAAEYFELEQKRLIDRQSANLPDEGRITRLMTPSPDLNEDDHFPYYSLTHEVDSLEVDYRGIVGERHQAVTRPSGGRELKVYPRGTKIRGHRHLFVSCSSDIAELSRRMGLEITAEMLGLNLLIDREDGEDFSITELPVGTMMLLADETATKPAKPPLATLISFVKQEGCGITGKLIADHYGDPALTRKFREATKDHRGILCSVEFPVEATVQLEKGQRVFFRYSRGLAP
ncbi:hypothetical protein MLD52_13810 [Puniceicoccaceae bacterium K14]|nr:hypothetical protein [Puniceicoccaceae bacterium K14]